MITISESSVINGEEEKIDNIQQMTNGKISNNNGLIFDKNAPKPKLCHLKKWEYFNGYGFNLHSKTGQVIGKIDKNSPAESGGLEEGDRIIEVNNINVLNESHKNVVKIIKNGLQRDGKTFDDEVLLLLVDSNAFDYYKNLEYTLNSNMPNIIKYSNINLKEFYEIEMSRFKDENKKLVEENEKKEQNISELSQVNLKNQSLIQELSTQNKSLESQIKELESEIEYEKIFKTKLDEELDKFKTQVQLLELNNENLKKLNNEKNESENSFKSELELSKSKLKEKDNLIKNQNIEIKNCNKELKIIKKQIDELKLDNEKSLKKIENLIVEHENSLKILNNDFEIKIKQLENELNFEIEKYETLNKSFENLQRANKVLKANLKANETSISENNALVNSQKNEINERNNQIKILNELNSKNEDLLNSNSNGIKNLEDKVKLLEFECKKFKDLYNQKLDSEHNLKVEFDIKRAEYENNIDNQKNYIEKIQELNKALLQKLNKFELEQEGNYKEKKELNEINNRLTDEKDKLYANIYELNVTIEAEKEKNKNLLKNVDDLQGQIGLLEVATQKFEDLLNDKNNKEKDLISKLELVETKILERTNLIEKLNQDIMYRDMKIVELKEAHDNEVNRLQIDFEISSKKNENLINENNISGQKYQDDFKLKEATLQEQIDKLNSENDALVKKHMDEIKQIQIDSEAKKQNLENFLSKENEKEINTLKTTNSSLENEINQLNEIIIQMQTEQDYLKKQKAQSKKKFDEAHNLEKFLKEKISNLENEIKSQMNKYKNEVDTLNVLKASELIMVETDFNAKIQRLEKENAKLKELCDKRIANQKDLLTELIVAETKLSDYKKLIDKLNIDISDREYQINQLIENHDKKVFIYLKA